MTLLRLKHVACAAIVLTGALCASTSRAIGEAPLSAHAGTLVVGAESIGPPVLELTLTPGAPSTAAGAHAEQSANASMWQPVWGMRVAFHTLDVGVQGGVQGSTPRDDAWGARYVLVGGPALSTLGTPSWGVRGLAAVQGTTVWGPLTLALGPALRPSAFVDGAIVARLGVDALASLQLSCGGGVDVVASLEAGQDFVSNGRGGVRGLATLGLSIAVP